MSRLRELAQDVRTVLRRSVGASSKFIAYFQLLDAFKQSGCPVCTRLEQGALKALDGLMYEQVNDPYTRDRLLESHGFCNWHAWMLPTIHNSALGVALIYRHLLQETLDRLQAAQREVHPRSRLRRLREVLTGSAEEPLPILAWRNQKTSCYLCTFARRSEGDDLKTILDFIGEPNFAGAFAKSAGLCLPHLYAAMRIGRDHPNLATLLSAHEKRWQDLLWELDELARKFDYRYADEAKGRESSSWHRALEAFVGRVSVFGPERGDAILREAEPAAAPSPTAGGSGEAATGSGQPDAIEALRFENEKLHRRIEELLVEREEDRQGRLALEFQVLKLTSDLKAMATGLTQVGLEESAPPDSPRTGADPGAQSAPRGGEE